MGPKCNHPVQAKFNAPVRCRLCGANIEVLSNFRATAAQCPQCGVKFTFDPQESPLGVQGVTLCLDAVREAARRTSPRSNASRCTAAKTPIPLG